MGNNYSPDGSDFTITALQGIDASNPLGQSGFGTQVNLNFETDPSIGVTYDQGGVKLTDFGIGLYSSGKNGPAESTGLSIQYNTVVDAMTANLQLEDFDLKSGATGFKPNKVTPSVSIYGANNKFLGTATSSQVFAAMSAVQGLDDVWDLNIGKLMSEMHVTGGLTKVVLAADATQGENTHSDPYQLRTVGKAKPVPEPASLCALAAGAMFFRRRRAKSQS